MEAKDGARSSADDLKSGDEKEPEEAAANAGHQLVMALVQHASRVLHSDMAGFFEEHVESFMDFEDADARERGAGDSNEQYGIFRLYTAELEHHFDGVRGAAPARDVQRSRRAIRVQEVDHVLHQPDEVLHCVQNESVSELVIPLSQWVVGAVATSALVAL